MTRREKRGSLSLADLCRTLGRTPISIGSRCTKLGLSALGATPAVALHQAWFGGVQ